MISTDEKKYLSEFQMECRARLQKALHSAGIQPTRMDVVQGKTEYYIEIDVEEPDLKLWIYYDDGACIQDKEHIVVLEWQDYGNDMTALCDKFVEIVEKRILSNEIPLWALQ